MKEEYKKEFGCFYKEILEDISEVNDPNDFEAFTRIRKSVTEHIVLLSKLASEPNPADGAQEVDINTLLSWKPGKDVLSYDVYLGTDYDDVNDAIYVDTAVIANNVVRFDMVGITGDKNTGAIPIRKTVTYAIVVHHVTT